MSRVNIDAQVWGDPRFALLAKLAGWPGGRFEAIGRLAQVWWQCTELETDKQTEALLATMLEVDIGSAGPLLEEAGLGVVLPGGEVRVKGCDGRTDWLKKRRIAGRKGGQAKGKQRASTASTNVQANDPPPAPAPAPAQESKSSDVVDAGSPPPKAKRASRTPHPEAVRIARRLVASIVERLPGSKPAREPVASANRWAKDIDKLYRLDRRPWTTIEEVAGWSQRDPFWQANILSGATLRAQFDKLEAAKAKAGGGRRPSQPDDEYVEIGERR